MKHPNLNEQKDSKKLMLFRNGVTSLKPLLTAYQGLFSLGKLFFGSCNSVDKCTIMSLTSI